MSVLDYVSSFRERLHRACKVAKAHLVKTQSKMKAHYDKQSVVRNFQPGEKVLVLLPVPGSALQDKFSGPYVVEKKLGDTDYEISTPDRKRKTRLCHVNMLKAYVTRSVSPESIPKPVSVLSTSVKQIVYNTVDGGLADSDAHGLAVRLNNSSILSDLK